MEIGILAAVVVLATIFIFFAVFKSFVHVGRPNQILIFSGRDNKLESGEKVGYRVVLGGFTFRRPVVEQFAEMDLRVFPVRVEVRNAYSSGGIPLNVQAIANVKISSDPRFIHNAIERFLGRGRDEMVRVAQETLEGNLRSVLATLSPEQVNESRLEFANRVSTSVKPQLERLGLQVDTLKIQNVSDEREYLNSIGRKRIAEIIKVAEVSESNAMREAEETEASNQARGEVARRNAQAAIQQKQNELRQYEADLELEAKSEEERAEASALAARAEAEQELQQVRTELEKLRLQADVVIPAEANKVARELLAAGEAASIAERGRAMAEVLRYTAEVWAEAGDAAMDIFMIHHLDHIMAKISEAARQVEVREVALIDGGDGTSLPNYVASFPKIVGSLFEEMRQIVGLDIGGALTGNPGPTTRDDGRPRPKALGQEEPANLGAAASQDARKKAFASALAEKLGQKDS